MTVKRNDTWSGGDIGSGNNGGSPENDSDYNDGESGRRDDSKTDSCNKVGDPCDIGLVPCDAV